MRFQKVALQIVFLMGLIAAFMLVRSYENPNLQTVSKQVEVQSVDSAERIKRLEPEIPLNINNPPFFSLPFPSHLRPVAEILEKGQELPLEQVYQNQEWIRPSYREYWHSTTSAGRWSYVPNRIYYAMHRLYTTYMTASIYYDFVHDLGIAEESNSFNHNITNPFEKIIVVSMQADIQKAVSMDNQVVLVCKPKRSGLQVWGVQTGKIKPQKPDEHILFQLVTSEGDEIDYSLISYAQWK